MAIQLAAARWARCAEAPTCLAVVSLQVLDKLLGERIDILVAGDSMMRQLYTRVVQMLRGRRRVFDYRVRKVDRPAPRPFGCRVLCALQ